MHIQANAKLTTSLRVTGVRPDGLHQVDIEMCSIDLCDELEFSEGNDLTVSGPYAQGVPTGAENLISRALLLCGATASVALVKNIPRGAGLGGGSADAAAVLKYLNRADIELAAQLGSDVAFCLHGGRARVTGAGEIIEPLPFVDQRFVLFVVPLAVSSARVYAEWDAMGGPTGENGNDLEPAALSAYPELKKYRDVIGDATGLTPRLAGSGSTWFIEIDANVTGADSFAAKGCQAKLVRSILRD